MRTLLLSALILGSCASLGMAQETETVVADPMPAPARESRLQKAREYMADKNQSLVNYSEKKKLQAHNKMESWKERAKDKKDQVKEKWSDLKDRVQGPQYDAQ